MRACAIIRHRSKTTPFEEPHNNSVKARDLGLFDTPRLAHNLWTQEDITDFKVELSLRVQPHETILLKVS